MQLRGGRYLKKMENANVEEPSAEENAVPDVKKERWGPIGKRKICPAKPKTIVKKHKPEWVKVFKDGREWLNLDTHKGKEEYTRRTIQVWSQNNEQCFYCRRKLDALEVTADHWIPRGLGGATHDDRIENLRPACWSCNTKKGSRRLERPEDLALIP